MKKAALFIFILLLSSALWAQNRYALIIGNANYPKAEDRLPNAINDTNAVSAALRELGFSVELKQNLRRLDMVKEISAFMTRLGNNRNSEGFLWYAGHAMEINGENLLFPLDVNIESDELIRATSFSLNDLTRQFSNVKNKVNVLVLDACRVPPSDSKSRGAGDTTRVIKTVPVTPPDLFVFYSTAPGTVALDGTGNRSPFAEAFLKNVKSTEPLAIMSSHVTTDTLSLTGQRQRPYTSGSMGRDNAYYSLNPAGVRPPPSPPERPVAPNMVRIQGGTFTMGSPANEPGRDDDEVQRRVTISSFYMGKYEVTQKEWYDVMGTTVRQQRDKADKSWSIYGEGNNYPMYYVSWYEAVEYCNKRSQKEGLTPAYTINGTNVTWNRSANGYRLPTEAEWEYACRAGMTTAYNTGASITNNTGWYSDNSGGSTQEVGRKPANAWGLHDMHGNVWEWCWDWYGDYASGAQTDPTGASSGSNRVYRGGSWGNSAQSVRSAYRNSHTPSYRGYNLGIRVLRP